MSIPVRMPQFGEAAADATVVAWLVQPGTAVKAEQELVEVQTEKSLLTVAAPVDGILVDHAAAPGQTVAVGDLLAHIRPVGTPAEPAPAPDSAVPTEVHPIGTAPKAVTVPKKPTKAQLPLAERSALLGAMGEAAFLSPRVRAKVAEAGLKASDLTAIVGTGIGGRITAEDIDKYLALGEPMSPVRQAVASAMSRSWSRPLATVAKPALMDALLAHRRVVDGRPSATIYALRALALAIAQGTPLAAKLHGNRLTKPQSIDLAIAVEIDGGVLTPVVRGVDKIPLAQLTATVEQVIDRARAGRVADSGDAVATVSNYGTFGLTWATPIPLAGQPMILGIGAVQNVPDWNPATKSWDRARSAELTLTFDHRIADGGAAGRLLAAVCDYLEKPEKML